MIRNNTDLICLICLKSVNSFNIRKSHLLFESFLQTCSERFGLDGNGLFRNEGKPGLKIWESPLFCKKCEGVLASITELHQQLVRLEVSLFGGVKELLGIMGGAKRRLSAADTEALLRKLGTQWGGMLDFLEIGKFREDLYTKYEISSKYVSQHSMGNRDPSSKSKTGNGGGGVADGENFNSPAHQKTRTVVSLEEDEEDELDGEDDYDEDDAAVDASYEIEQEDDDDDEAISADENPLPNDDNDVQVVESEPVASSGDSSSSSDEDEESEEEKESSSESPSEKLPKNKESSSESENEARLHDVPAPARGGRPKSVVCALCNQKFRSYIHLVDHEREHNFEFKLGANGRCDKCEFISSPAELYDHLATAHGEVSRLTCQSCQVVLPNCLELYKHVESLHGNLSSPPVTCVYCPKEFRSQQLADIHKYLKHFDLPQTYSCEEGSCQNLEFPSAQKLVDHLTSAHSGFVIFSCQKCGMGFLTEHLRNFHALNHLSKNKTDSGQQKYACLEVTCPSELATRRELIYHFNRFHQRASFNSRVWRCDSCTLSFTSFFKKELDRHVESHKWGIREFFHCSLCIEEFPSRDQIQQHVVDVHGHVPTGFSATAGHFSCDKCQQECSSIRELKKHVRTRHPISFRRPSCCEHCGKVLSSKASLDLHIRVVHTREGMVMCELCGKEFGERSGLKSHMRELHEAPGMGKFECSFCPRKFHRRRFLNCHVMRKHTGGSYSCKWCTTKAPRLPVLRTHVRDQHPSHLEQFEEEWKAARTSVCDTCGKTFRSKYILTKHVKDVHGRAHYPCTACPKRFLTQAKLESHLRSHNGYKCDWCSETYAKPKGLRLHVEEEHPEHLHEVSRRQKQAPKTKE